MKDLIIKLEEKPDSQAKKFIVDSLVAFNYTKAKKGNYKALVLTLRNKNNILFGGLVGYTHWDWIFVSHLWIHQDLKNNGYGKKLLESAEQEALKRDCHSAHLDTFDFQATGFYQKMGYEIFGELTDYPLGHKRYFLKKNLILKIS